MVIELICLGVGAFVVISAWVVGGRLDRRSEHRPRALELPDPDKGCTCTGALMHLPTCPTAHGHVVHKTPTLNPNPVGGFGRCSCCGDSWDTCALGREAHGYACCSACRHEGRPRPMPVPGPGTPRSG